MFVGSILFLRGRNFGGNPNVVMVTLVQKVNSKYTVRCFVHKVNHTWLILETPSGGGSGYTFEVSLLGQVSNRFSQNEFSYLPPSEVFSVGEADPTTGKRIKYPTEGGVEVLVTGINFGYRVEEITLFIGSEISPRVKLLNSTHILAAVPPSTGSELSGTTLHFLRFHTFWLLILSFFRSLLIV